MDEEDDTKSTGTNKTRYKRRNETSSDNFKMFERNRKSRNLSEKKRRDQFNSLVCELSSMVSTNNRKMDKSTVLRSTISFLRRHNEVNSRSRANDIKEDWKPPFLSNEEFTHLILEALEGFMMVFSLEGVIYYASESATSLLGHSPGDLVNTSIYDLCFEEDRPYLFRILQNPESIDTTDSLTIKEKSVKFSCHIRRGILDSAEETTYELVQFLGYFRSDIDVLENDSRGSADRIKTPPRWMFVCTGRIVVASLLGELSPNGGADGSSEFTSRHSLEWKFLFLDHRAPPIIGYLPFEVLGTSGYDYYHFDDLDKVVSCHHALMQKGELTSCYYRFLTKGQQWIWLQTRFYITYHQWNSKPEFVVCTHRVISPSDVIKKEAEDQSPPKIEPLLADTPKQASQSTPTPPLNDTNVDMETVQDEDPEQEDNREHSPLEEYQTEEIHEEENQMVMSICRTRGSSSCRIRHLRGPGSDQTTISANSALSAMSAESSISTESVAVAQKNLQDRLRRKHEQLQRLIHHQQEELRRVSEQLVMARYGLLQPEHMYEDSYYDPMAGGPIAMVPALMPAQGGSVLQPMLPHPQLTYTNTQPHQNQNN